jgi:catechol 2,3-dioxygenase-like lactoylglutathione lyase family enzyme
MTVQRLEHIGVVVDDLAAATAFFTALGLELEGEASVEGALVDRINGLEGVRADIVILRTPDGASKIELATYRSPSYEGDDGPAPVGQADLARTRKIAQMRSQGGALQVGKRLGNRVGPAGVDPEAQRPLRADENRRRDEQLGHVPV